MEAADFCCLLIDWCYFSYFVLLYYFYLTTHLQLSFLYEERWVVVMWPLLEQSVFLHLASARSFSCETEHYSTSVLPRRMH